MKVRVGCRVRTPRTDGDEYGLEMRLFEAIFRCDTVKMMEDDGMLVKLEDVVLENEPIPDIGDFPVSGDDGVFACDHSCGVVPTKGGLSMLIRAEHVSIRDGGGSEDGCGDRPGVNIGVSPLVLIGCLASYQMAKKYGDKAWQAQEKLFERIFGDGGGDG